MTLKEYLEQVKNADTILANIEIEMDIIKNKRAYMERMCTSGSDDYNNSVIFDWRKLKDDFEKAMDNLISYQNDVIKLKNDFYEEISMLEDVRRDVLYYRYLEQLQWDEIAEKVIYGRTRVYQIHDAALKIIEARMKDNNKIHI